jgi:hypothetical protein
MSGHSPTDPVRRLAPITDTDAAAVFGAAGREGLLADLTNLPFGRGARRRPVTRRRRLVLAAAVVAVAGIATAATWVALGNAPARETTSVDCLIEGVDTIIPSTSGDPAQDCALEWTRELGSAAPALVAYDNTFGGVTVLPRSQQPPAGWKTLRSQDVALIELQDSLDDYINGLNSTCMSADAATRFTNARLAQFGFSGWTVILRNSGPCENADLVDPTTQSVTLAGGRAHTGPEQTFEKLAEKLRPVTRTCESLPVAVASVRDAAHSLGLSESAQGYDLNTATDNSLRCASVYETVGGTIFLTVRGPSG